MGEEKKKKLRSGFTTGAAAAAAVKGALTLLVEKKAPPFVSISLLTGNAIDIAVNTCVLKGESLGECTVIKDAGDDPDVTHRAVIGARVRLSASAGGAEKRMEITGGEGVGRVTKPGLEVPVGEAAINPGPLRMIGDAVVGVLGENHEQGVHVEVFVPRGKEMAKKTLNARLGIMGGISILGTTGVVRPMSHDAYIATIKSSFSVAKAMGAEHVVLTTGRRSEKYAQALFTELPEEAFVQVGDFFKMSVSTAREEGFKKATLAVFFGKAIKMAQRVPHTHAAKSSLSLTKLAGWTEEVTGDPAFSEEIRSANTGRQAFFMLLERYPEVIPHVGGLMRESALHFSGPGMNIQSVIFDFEGNVVFDSEQTEGVATR